MRGARTWLEGQWRKRPWWMNGMLLFCLYMTFVYLPYDLFVKPVADDEEVWFGIRFHGFWAKLLAVPHWVVYALGAVGLWRMSPWARPFLALYLVQVAISFAVWPWLYRADDPLAMRLLGSVPTAVFFLWLAYQVWRASARSQVAAPAA